MIRIIVIFKHINVFQLKMKEGQELMFTTKWWTTYKVVAPNTQTHWILVNVLENVRLESTYQKKNVRLESVTMFFKV
jgi:hypothetical protein